MKKIVDRIICANVHNDTGEVEIILEVKTIFDTNGFHDETDIKSIWLTQEELLKRILGKNGE